MKKQPINLFIALNIAPAWTSREFNDGLDRMIAIWPGGTSIEFWHIGRHDDIYHIETQVIENVNGDPPSEHHIEDNLPNILLDYMQEVLPP